MKPTTIRRRSSRSVVLRPVLAELSVTRCQAVRYVYQAMRVTGAADPTVPVSETLKGKLPQKKLVRGAASGYSSYGNQIGLATGLCKRDLSSELCGKTYGDRCCYGCCSEKRCHP